MPELADPVLIRHLNPKNLLSFGPDNLGIDLKALNVLIGPNGSGKSNLIEAIQLLRAAPRQFDMVFQSGGGFSEWKWKGTTAEKGISRSLSCECVINCGELDYIADSESTFRHSIHFGSNSQLMYERIVEFASKTDSSAAELYNFNCLDGGRVSAVSDNRERINVDINVDIQADHSALSVLAKLKDPKRYPEITAISKKYEQIKIYREWTFGRNAIFRTPQRNDVLEEDFSNLGLVLNRLKTRFPAAKKAILNGLKDLYDGITDFDVLIEGGSVQVFFTGGDFVIPATRLSDGTLRYLCLLAILCDPTPPPLICIEEPELGLHPDILPGLADLLRDASERTQLIVTTHSDILVDCMTETPECVVVCEKHDGKTEMRRLSNADLAVWLEKYRLGQLWIDGQLGGKRW